MAEATTRIVEQLDPRTLLLDKNVRLSAEADRDFVASIKDVGLLQPITAVRTTDRQLRVRFGHRRTVGAIAAGLATVPVEIIGDEGTDSAAGIERLVRQGAENTYRAALTVSEDAAVVEQLALLGVSDAQISKRLRLPRGDDRAARAVAGSKLARAAGDRYELDLAQAAAVAEFEDDTERVKALVAAAKTGQFEHALAQIRQEDENNAARQELIDALAAEGVRVVEEPGYGDSTKRLSSLYTAARTRLDPQAHTSCPGHAVFVDEDYVWVAPDGTEGAGLVSSGLRGRIQQNARSRMSTTAGQAFVAARDPKGG
jgi:ParB family chromosome partitioning protein